MARRKGDSPQKAALREMMSSFMKDNDVHIKDGNDVNFVMRDMMSIILDPRNRHGEYGYYSRCDKNCQNN